MFSCVFFILGLNLVCFMKFRLDFDFTTKIYRGVLSTVYRVRVEHCFSLLISIEWITGDLLNIRNKKLHLLISIKSLYVAHMKNAGEQFYTHHQKVSTLFCIAFASGIRIQSEFIPVLDSFIYFIICRCVSVYFSYFG